MTDRQSTGSGRRTRHVATCFIKGERLGPKTGSPFPSDFGLLMATQLIKCPSLVAQGIRMVWTKAERLVNRGQRILVTAQLAQSDTLVVPGHRIVGFQADSLVVGFNGFHVAAHLTQRCALQAPGVR